MRIACFSPYPASGASVRHRVLALAERWRADGIELTLYPFMDERFFALRRRFGALATAAKLALFAWATLKLMVRVLGVRRFDLVIIHREAFPLGPPWFERCIARLNPRVVYDFDDAIWQPPSNGVNQRKWLWDARRLEKIFALSRAVVAGSPELVRYAERHRAPVRQLATTYDDLGGAPIGNDRPVIVWIGNLGNADYLQPLAKVFSRLALRHAFTLRLIGGDDIDAIAPTGVAVERLRWSAAQEAAALQGADIGIMPLRDAPYERGKCAFKLIQYMAAGLPVVASPVGMNTDVVREGENGFLADSPDDWFAALDTLLADAMLRRRLGTAGYGRYLQSWSRDVADAAWRDIFRSVMA